MTSRWLRVALALLNSPASAVTRVPIKIASFNATHQALAPIHSAIAVGHGTAKGALADQIRLLPDAPVVLAAGIIQGEPLPARVEDIREAIDEFDHADTAKSVDNAWGAGDVILPRALGVQPRNAAVVLENPPATALSLSGLTRIPLNAPSLRTYRLSKPLHEHVELGPPSRKAHYILEVGYQFLKGLGLAHIGVPATFVIGYLATRVPIAFFWIPWQSLGDLKYRNTLRMYEAFGSIATLPGVKRLKVLTITSKMRFSYFVAASQVNDDIIFVETSEELPPDMGRFGEPRLIADLSSQYLKLELKRGKRKSTSQWRLNWKDFLSEQPIPAEIAAQWRKMIREMAWSNSAILHPRRFAGRIASAWRESHSEAKRLNGFIVRFMDADNRTLRITATDIGSDGEETQLGDIVFGNVIKVLAGPEASDRLLGLMRLKRSSRHISITAMGARRVILMNKVIVVLRRIQRWLICIYQKLAAMAAAATSTSVIDDPRLWRRASSYPRVEAEPRDQRVPPNSDPHLKPQVADGVRPPNAGP